VTPVVITGLSTLSALGVDRESFRRGLASPARLGDGAPLATPQSFPRDKHPDARVFEVPNFAPESYLGDKGLRTLDRLTKLLVVAARLCLADAKIKGPEGFIALSPQAVGFCCSNAYASLEAIHELDRVATLEDPRYINPAKFPNTVSNSASGYVSIWEDLRALNVTVSNGNPGGLDAFYVAHDHLEDGRASCILTGGGEAMSEALLIAWEKLRLPALKHAVALSEGTCFVALETEASARAREAARLAKVTGYGTAFDPSKSASLFHPGGRALTRAIRQALGDAGRSASDVDLVITGRAGIGAFDDAETGALTEAIGAGVPTFDVKRRLGETFGAGGALAVAAAVDWLTGAPLSGIAAARSGAVVLVTELGYYGNASALIVEGA
jgi:3-oxoacyl-(acyl-carrier-protein) synthase